MASRQDEDAEVNFKTGKILATTVLVVSITMTAHAAEPQDVIGQATSRALTEFQRTNDPSVIARALPVVNSEAENLPLATKGRDSVFRAFGALGNVLNERADPKFDPNRPPAINTAPDGPYPSGTDPANIKDEKVRKAYEARLASDRQYAEYFNQQRRLDSAIEALSASVQQQRGTLSDNEIAGALTSGGMKPVYAEQLINRNRAR
jgi:hypothetical protein